VPSFEPDTVRRKRSASGLVMRVQFKDPTYHRRPTAVVRIAR
jgi:hypothetical protein